MIGKISRTRTNVDEVFDTACGPVCAPIDELVVVPQRWVRPKRRKVRTQYTLGIGMLGQRDTLRDIAGSVEVQGAKGASKKIERLSLWKMRGRVESDSRPFIWPTVLQDESEHLAKIGLFVQPRARLAKIHPHVLAPTRPLL